MREKDILCDKSGLTVRVLVLEEHASWVVDCSRCRMPFMLDNGILNDMEAVNAGEYRIPFTDEELDAKQKETRDKRNALIEPLLAVECITNKATRNRIVGEIVTTEGVNRKTIQQYLWRFWVYQSRNALLPAERKKKESQQLTQDQKNMRWALNKFYYSRNRHTLKNAYTLMLKEKYTDVLGVLQEPYPSFWQFRYFFTSHRDPIRESISREGLKKYQRDHRAFTGDVREYAAEIGTFMTDATIADIYIVSRFSRKVIGRPVIYTMVDAHTNLIAGLYVGLEGGKHGLRMLLANTVMNKSDYCQQCGIAIEPQQWPAHHLPRRILTDRGTEFVGDVLENLCREYYIEIVNLPAYRPDLKGPVEQLFNLLQNAYKPHLKGRGIIEPDFQERGGRDYRKDSTLDLEQFTAIVIKCVLFYNGENIMNNYPRTESQIAANVPPIAARLWLHSISQPEGALQMADSRFALALMPRTTGNMTQRGLEVHGTHYNNPDYNKRFVWAGMKGKEKVTVAYNPDDLSVVWLYEGIKYTPFEVVQSRFRGKTLDELNQLRREEKELKNNLQKGELQARIDLISDIEDIAAQAPKPEPQTVKAITTGIRQNRAVEQLQEPSIFEILKAQGD